MHNYSENIQFYASVPTKTCREEQLRSLFLHGPEGKLTGIQQIMTERRNDYEAKGIH